MTPQERQLVDDLFDRLARLETSPRDREAERAVADGMARAPHAVYALVQTVLVQDEALKRAEAQLRELSEQESQAGSGFLDTMRNAFGGRGSVPSVRPGASDTIEPRWNQGGALPQGGQHFGQDGRGFAQQAAPMPQQQQPAQGGSFLGTAAATAAGVIGGSMLFNSLGGMFGNRSSGQAAADVPGDKDAGGKDSPWGNDSAPGNDLSREAGANDVGKADDNQSSGLFGGDDEFDVSDGGDFGDFDGGDTV